MKIAQKIALVGSICLMSYTNSWAEKLPVGSPERVQLEAMGYEFQKEDPKDTMSVASSGAGKIVFEKRDNQVVLSRYFTRRTNLTAAEDVRLLKKVNEINVKYAYQVSISDTFITTSLYAFGPHNPRTFSMLVRLLEKADIIFDEDALKLLN
jgi:hypothetical protein